LPNNFVTGISQWRQKKSRAACKLWRPVKKKLTNRMRVLIKVST
jgi:hypothetical protein